MSIRQTAILIFGCFLFAVSCTSSRWVITDQNAIDTSKAPIILGEETILLLQREATVDNPVMSFSVHKVVEQQFEQRVKVERTIQEYRPNWKFLVLGITGAAVAAAAANTSLLLPNATSNQKLALNITSGLLAVFSITNLQPSGEPIYTGETNLTRRSGFEVRFDTLQHQTAEIQLTADIAVTFHDDTVYTQNELSLTNGFIEINLARISESLDKSLNHESVFNVMVSYNGSSDRYEVPVRNFLSPYVTITDPVVVLRNAPAINELNIITEVGAGSFLELIDDSLDDWYRVRFGGSEVFISKNAGEIEWLSVATAGLPDVFEFEEVPFGQVDVENSVPILKRNNPNDRAIILTNGFTDEAIPRQYLNRDHDLFRFYMRFALQLTEDQIHTIEITPDDSWKEELRAVAGMDSTGSLFVWLSGYATISEDQEILLDFADNPNGEGLLSGFLPEQFERLGPEAVYLFCDLEFSLQGSQNGLTPVRSVYNLALQETANSLLRVIPNSVIIFSNRPGQTSSLYTGRGFENKRHHIFNYYWGDALKRRNTRMSALIRHLENNVDYTSRRLHDRPQEIQAFGNFTLSITD